MVGVLLAFCIERSRARRDAKMLYGRLLQTSRSELAYLKPMCESRGNGLRDGRSAGTLDLAGVPVLISPLVQEQAPYSLIMALTALCSHLTGTENAFQEARRLDLQNVGGRELLGKFADELDKASSIITIAIEQIDSQLNLLGLKTTPDAATQEVSRRLREVLQGSPPSRTDEKSQLNPEVPETE